MQRMVVLWLLMALAIPATSLAAPPEGRERPAPARTANSPDCAAQQGAMASLGRPTAQARLLASRQEPVQAAPATTVGASNVYIVRAGDTLSQIAARFNSSVYALMVENQIRNPNLIYVGQRLAIGGLPVTPYVATTSATAGPLLSPFDRLWLDGEAVQGEAVLIWVRAAPGTTLAGQVGSQQVAFHPHCGLHWGIVAFDALLDQPGTHPLRLTATAPNGSRVVAHASIPLQAGSFWEGPPVEFPPDKQRLLQPETVRAENGWLEQRFARAVDPRSAPRWSGPFQRPLGSVMTGTFGSRGIRDGKYTGYHEGIDYRGAVGTPFFAPAPGVVLIAESLTVRGGTVFLDHGAGVVSGYFHMSDFAVQPGDEVQTGQLLGWVGASGLTTGPHLHWEMRVNNRWVNPATWLARSFP